MKIFKLGILGFLISGTGFATYTINWQTIDFGGGSRSSTNYCLYDSSIWFEGEKSTSTNYVVKPGFVQSWVIAPDIVVKKEASPNKNFYTKGETITFTLNGTNTKRGKAKNVKIIDMIPSGTKYDGGATCTTHSATITYSHNGGMDYDESANDPVTHIKWVIDLLEANGTFTVRFGVKIKD